MRLKVLSYNIHKGFSSTGLKFTLEEIKIRIRETGANIVCLQEIKGLHEGQSQLEYLADQMWPHYSYGQNAVYEKGHHGNAVLTEFPITSWINTDVSTNRFESRGLLWCRTQPPVVETPVHVITVHLNLMEEARLHQVERLIEKVTRLIPSDAPLIIAGDFNDWTGRVGRKLRNGLLLKEAFFELHQNYAKTFPAAFPFLRLDRVYYRNLELENAKILGESSWKNLSDHLPLLVEFELKT